MDVFESGDVAATTATFTIMGALQQFIIDKAI
jgi:hypothetical protein